MNNPIDLPFPYTKFINSFMHSLVQGSILNDITCQCMTSIFIRVVFSMQIFAIIRPEKSDLNMYFIFIFNDKTMAQICKISREKIWNCQMCMIGFEEVVMHIEYMNIYIKLIIVVYSKIWLNFLVDDHLLHHKIAKLNTGFSMPNF